MAKAATKERDIEVDRDPDEAAQAAADKALDKEIDAAIEDDGPDNAAARREQEREAAKVRDGENDQDDRLAYDLENDAEAGPQERDSRRKRRNRVRREAQIQSTAEIAALNQRVLQLSGMIDQMSKGQVGLAVGTLDEQIRGMQGRLQEIDAAMGRAVKEQDEDTYTRGLRLRDEARDRLQQLGYAKQRLITEANERRVPENNGLQPNPQQGQPPPHPDAVRYSEQFLDDNPWFDPTAPRGDRDSLRAREIDVELSNEGYLPNKKAYWDEFNRRVRKENLGRDFSEDENNMDDNRETQRPAPRSNGLPPRSGRSNGRQDGGSQSFKLTQDMQDALDAEGLLDTKSLTKEQTDYRRRLVTKWRDGFKAAEQARR